MKLYLDEKKKKLFIKTIVWNSLVDYFANKNIDIKDFLISIKISGKNISIKTGKPILNSEILNNKSFIFSILKQKFHVIDEKFEEYNFKVI